MATDITEVRPAGAPPGAAVPARSRHLGLALVVISMAQLMLVLDELIVNTALPHIQQALHFSGTGLEWVVTGYAVTFGGLLMLGDRAGVYLILLFLASTFFGMFFFLTLFTQLVAGIANEHQGVASSMFNAGQQIGGAVGLAVIGSVAWTVVNRHVRDSLSHVAVGHHLAGHAAAGRGSPIYQHALSSGVTTALTMGAGATLLALIVTVIAIPVRLQDLPDSPLVM